MKAIFMTEVGGRLMEIERRVLKPTLIHYRAVMEPVQMRSITEIDTTQPPIAKREVWLCKSKPVTEDDFAVFILDRIE